MKYGNLGSHCDDETHVASMHTASVRIIVESGMNQSSHTHIEQIPLSSLHIFYCRSSYDYKNTTSTAFIQTTIGAAMQQNEAQKHYLNFHWLFF